MGRKGIVSLQLVLLLLFVSSSPRAIKLIDFQIIIILITKCAFFIDFTSRSAYVRCDSTAQLFQPKFASIYSIVQSFIQLIVDKLLKKEDF